VPWVALYLDSNWISHAATRDIVERRLTSQADETWRTVGAFLDSFEVPEMRNLVTEAVAEERKIPNPETQIADVTLKLRNQFLDRQINTLTQNASRPENGETERVGFLRQQQKLREQKRAPLPPLN
jgi:hypothetical protein